jgi:hypothetical protein
MRIPRSWRTLLGHCAIAMMFAGCAGGAPRTSPVAVQPGGDAFSERPDAKAQDLLYVSDLGANAVDVYSYPQGALVTTLTGFGSVAGLCVDKAGDVFVVDEAGPVDVYAHGGTSPIRKLQTSGAPDGCAIDPSTGNLALTNLSSYLYGTISIYSKAKGKPKSYFNDTVNSTFFCGYDGNGNLFIDGWDRSAVFILIELPKHGNTFRIFHPNNAVKNPTGVQWDGKYIAVGDRDAGAVYRTSETGKIEQTVKLKGGVNVDQFWIQGSALVGPVAHSPGAVKFWSYPAGGSATKTLSGFSYPVGAVVSVAH